MSDVGDEKLTGFDLWTPNDYSNFITISAAAIGSTLLVLFKSRCSKISLCFGLWSCDREVKDDDENVEQQNNNNNNINSRPQAVVNNQTPQADVNNAEP